MGTKKYVPDANDPYQDVALIFAGFLCDLCGEYCAGNPDGSTETPLCPDGATDLDCVAMARIARDLGWIVKAVSETNDFSVLCPACVEPNP